MVNKLISKQAVIQAMRMMPIPKQAINNDWFGAVTAGVNAEIKLVAEFPAVDAVEVVRCKDCIYLDKSYVNGRGFRICPASGMDITDNDFCSYGERREENG